MTHLDGPTQDEVDRAIFEVNHPVTYCLLHRRLVVHTREQPPLILVYSSTLSDNVDLYTTEGGQARLVLKRLGEDDLGELKVVSALRSGR